MIALLLNTESACLSENPTEVRLKHKYRILFGLLYLWKLFIEVATVSCCCREPLNFRGLVYFFVHTDSKGVDLAWTALIQTGGSGVLTSFLVSLSSIRASLGGLWCIHYIQLADEQRERMKRISLIFSRARHVHTYITSAHIPLGIYWCKIPSRCKETERCGFPVCPGEKTKWFGELITWLLLSSLLPKMNHSCQIVTRGSLRKFAHQLMYKKVVWVYKGSYSCPYMIYEMYES